MMKFNPQLQARLREFTDWWDARGKDLDAANEVLDLLYHYTDMGGLLGIVNNQEIWLTSIFHLNDRSELGYGVEMALNIMKADAESGPDVSKAFCAWMKHLLLKSGGEVFGFFVGSFSRESDDLGQWRVYADNGRGVAIGLAPRLFQVRADQTNVGLAEKVLMAQVIYDRDQCLRNMGEAIRRAVTIIVRAETEVTSQAEGHKFLRELATQLAVSMFTYGVTCKHQAYKHECETRMLAINQLDILAPITETRTRGSTLVPFIRSSLPVRSAGAIMQILIDPAADSLSDDAVHALLRRHALPLDIVQQSGISYTAR
jgi:hypothetical protein